MRRMRNLWDAEGGRSLEGFFKGLADTSRLRILNLLFQGELCGCDIQHVLEASQSNVSRHLTYLKNSGLVLDRRSGYRVYYRLRTSSSLDHKLLFEYLRSAVKRDKLFAADVKKLKDAIKEGACTVSELKRDLLSARSGPQTHMMRSRAR
jgi:ArsR family transcriptional regulator